jgi:hypothetical protein
MRYLSLTLIALATAAVIAPPQLHGQDAYYDFTFTEAGASAPVASGWIEISTVSGYDYVGQYNVIGGDVSFDGTTAPLYENPSDGTLAPGVGFSAFNIDLSQPIGPFHDVFYTNPYLNPAYPSYNGTFVDFYGLIFGPAANGDYLNIGEGQGGDLFGHGYANQTYLEIFDSNGDPIDSTPSANGTFAVTPASGPGFPSEPDSQVPEGGALWTYLLVAGTTCFGAIFVARHRDGSRLGGPTLQNEIPA